MQLKRTRCLHSLRMCWHNMNKIQWVGVSSDRYCPTKRTREPMNEQKRAQLFSCIIYKGNFVKGAARRNCQVKWRCPPFAIASRKFFWSALVVSLTKAIISTKLSLHRVFPFSTRSAWEKRGRSTFSTNKDSSALVFNGAEFFSLPVTYRRLINYMELMPQWNFP